MGGYNSGKRNGKRIQSRHDALVQVSMHDIGRKLGILYKLLEA